METYLTEMAYRRWYRQYQVNQEAYIEKLDKLRVRVDNLPHEISTSENTKLMNREAIEESMSIIDEALEEAIPRDFSSTGTPMSGEEKFSENCKVLINLIRQICRKPGCFEGIYKEEKDRVLNIHKTFKFKEKLNQVQEMIEQFENVLFEKMHEEQQEEQEVDTVR